jgi:hypothetical protein
MGRNDSVSPASFRRLINWAELSRKPVSAALYRVTWLNKTLAATRRDAYAYGHNSVKDAEE